jgi:hypothetical protein
LVAWTPAAALREQAARALVNLGMTLGQLGRSEEELAACRAVLERYGEDPAPALREIVAFAKAALGSESAGQ